MKVSVVIPTYNERETIKTLIKNIFALGIVGLEVIVVDDGSSDGTLEVVRALRKRFPVTIIVRPKKMGLGSALKDGLGLALTHGANVVITMDADLSHEAAVIPEMLKAVEKGADLVVGSRRIVGGCIVGWGPWRTAMSRGAMQLARGILRLQARDVTSGFRAYRRGVLETLRLRKLASTGYAFQEEILFRVQRAGFRVQEIPITFHDRRHGKSKLGLRDILEFFVTVAKLRFYA